MRSLEQCDYVPRPGCQGTGLDGLQSAVGAMAHIQDTSAQDRPVVRSGPRRSTVLLVGAVGLAAVVAIPLWPKLARWSRAEASFERARLRMATVERGTLVRDLSVEGRIVAASYPTLFSPAEGTVALAVRAGEAVEAGQVVARVSSPDLESALRQESAGLAALESELSFLEVSNKTAKLRIFPSDHRPIDRSVVDVAGSALVVSQFTLCADTRKGNRPSFVAAAPPEEAERLYGVYCARLRAAGVPVETGRFGAMMDVELVNDGPVTIVLDGRQEDAAGSGGNG